MNIVVLDGRDVPNPEDLAMLLALYSRSPKPVMEHLAQVKKRGSASFVETYYAGYGHKSIGDCGTTAICFEHISMLAAKAVQDSPLYAGQEASTRYLDMAAQEVLNPLGSPEGKAVQDGWMALYSRTLATLIPTLKERFPRKDEEKETFWEKAIKAKAFDIARSLLPAGATTFVAWLANLRQAHDHTKELRNHTLPEVRELGNTAIADLKIRYPSSFSQKINDAEEDYIRQSMNRFAFHDGGADHKMALFADFRNLEVARLLIRHRDLLASRPPRTELHQRFRQYGVITFNFELDFGSYRDLQRQRSAVQEMPLLSTRLGFHPWYIEQLPAGTFEEIERLRFAVERLPAEPMIKQYYTAMGYLVPVTITCPLPAAVYIAELRSGQTVHPTLRAVAQRMGNVLKESLTGLTMHHDTSPDEWSIKRGTQDIVKRG